MNESQTSTAMVGALTLNIHRKPDAEVANFITFLPFPAAAKPKLKGITPEVIVQILKVVPSPQMASLIQPMKEELMAEYYWGSNEWMRDVD
jgi:hypothetical protein